MKSFKEAGPDGVAFWIDPEGRVYFVPDSHVAWVCDRPEYCGFTENYLRSVYDRCKEPYRQDGGGARNVIVYDLVDRGWVRLRRFRFAWSFSTNHTPEAEERLRAFLWAVRTRGVYGWKEDDDTLPVHREGCLSDRPLDELLHGYDSEIVLRFEDLTCRIDLKDTGS